MKHWCGLLPHPHTSSRPRLAHRESHQGRRDFQEQLEVDRTNLDTALPASSFSTDVGLSILKGLKVPPHKAFPSTRFFHRRRFEHLKGISNSTSKFAFDPNNTQAPTLARGTSWDRLKRPPFLENAQVTA